MGEPNGDAPYKDPETLRRLYHEEGLTQTEISERFDVNDSVISRLFSKYDIAVVYNPVPPSLIAYHTS